MPTKDEVHNAVWSLDSQSSAGSDGYDGCFYQTCWDIIWSDVYKAVKEFFLGFPLPKAAAHTMIVLLPKGATQTNFADYRPIALCTFLSKIQTRILATRLSIILPIIISSEQASFQKERALQNMCCFLMR